MADPSLGRARMVEIKQIDVERIQKKSASSALQYWARELPGGELMMQPRNASERHAARRRA